MAKMSRQTKEIIKTVAFLLVVGVLIFFYVIYPLTRAKIMMGREDFEDYNPDSLVINEPGIFTDSGLPVDTFNFESDGLTTLACLYINAINDTTTSPMGSVILLHADKENRDSLFYLARVLHDSGYVVITYDQRASRFSTGKFRGEGFYEASDIESLISYLELREKIKHPLYVVGFETGAEGAMIASLEENRINGVVAINPYLTTQRMQNLLKDKYKAMWFPFYRTMTWWWYDIRSGYAAPYRKVENIKAVPCPTLVLIPSAYETDIEIEKLKELSSPEMLTVKTIAEDKINITADIIKFLQK